MGMQNITNKVGTTIAIIHTDSQGRARVTDAVGRLLGTASSNGTFNDVGVKISNSYVPGLLVRGLDDDEEDDD